MHSHFHDTVLTPHLNELEGRVLDLLVGVPEVEVEQVEYLGLVHLAPTDLVVLQLVPGDE